MDGGDGGAMVHMCMCVWVGVGQHTPVPLIPLEDTLLGLLLVDSLPLVDSARSLGL